MTHAREDVPAQLLVTARICQVQGANEAALGERILTSVVCHPANHVGEHCCLAEHDRATRIVGVPEQSGPDSG
ncbi:MAG: hypothetical protein ACRDZ4_07475 [Egibacteraceae bacterium]